MLNLQRLSSVSVDIAQYAVGFLDGDGCVHSDVWRSGKACYPYISAKQAHNHGQPPELVHLQTLYGGALCQKTVAHGTTRAVWELSLRAENEVEALLIDMVRYGIMNRAAAAHALGYIRNDKADPHGTKASIIACHASYQGIDIDETRLTPAYLAGLFAADGSVGLYNRVSMAAKITQNGCVRLLQAIRARLGCGVINHGELIWQGASAANVLQVFRPWLDPSQKKPQVDIALNWLAIKETRKRWAARTQQECAYDEGTAQELKRLKKM
jgi:hypothetical protein